MSRRKPLDYWSGGEDHDDLDEDRNSTPISPEPPATSSSSTEITHNNHRPSRRVNEPLIIYVKQSYSLPGYSIITPCASSESLSTMIDLNRLSINSLNHNQSDDDEDDFDDDNEEYFPLKPMNACPITHQILMLLSLKQTEMIRQQQQQNDSDDANNYDDLRFDVRIVNPTRMLPIELRLRMINTLPVLLDPNNHHQNNNRIFPLDMDLIDYLQKNYPTKRLDIPLDCSTATDFVWNLIRSIQNLTRLTSFYAQKSGKFSKYHSNTNSGNDDRMERRRQLSNSFGKFDKILSKYGTKYAVTDHHPTVIDCHLMPRLHQIRVLLEWIDDSDDNQQEELIKDVDGTKTLWNYYQTTYKLKEFRLWCPSDQEIIINWLIKNRNQNSNKIPNSRHIMMKLIRSKPTYNFNLSSSSSSSSSKSKSTSKSNSKLLRNEVTAL